MAFRALAGLGLAGTYMPGLRVLVDRYSGDREPRAIAFYTSSFSLGTSLSFLLAGEVGDAFGWRWAFAVAALVGLGAIALVGLGLAPIQPHRAPEGGSAFDFRPVLRNRPAMGYILGYGIHTGELFALRSWQVAMLAFVLAGSTTEAAGWPRPTTVAMLAGLLAMVSSIGGNELAGRLGRRRTVVGVMLGSSLTAAALAWGADGGYAGAVILMLVYTAFVQADSAALTAGVVGVAEPGRRGVTLALHSLIGFGGGFLAPLGLGIVLDLAGGPNSAEAWRLAFLSMAAIGLAGPVVVAWLRR
jgi:MFS family permease